MTFGAALRRCAERLSRGRVLKRRLPAEFGKTPLYVSPDSQLKYLKIGREAFDAELLQVALDEIGPGMVVWDVGANVGVFTFAAASLAESGSVLAIEADIWLTQLIRRSANIKENREFDITI